MDFCLYSSQEKKKNTISSTLAPFHIRHQPSRDQAHMMTFQSESPSIASARKKVKGKKRGRTPLTGDGSLASEDQQLITCTGQSQRVFQGRPRIMGKVDFTKCGLKWSITTWFVYRGKWRKVFKNEDARSNG